MNAATVGRDENKKYEVRISGISPARLRAADNLTPPHSNKYIKLNGLALVNYVGNFYANLNVFT
jgi:hypothetical protein